MQIECIDEIVQDMKALNDQCEANLVLEKLRDGRATGNLIANIKGNDTYQLRFTTELDGLCGIMYQLPAKDQMLILWIGAIQTVSVTNLGIVRL